MWCVQISDVVHGLHVQAVILHIFGSRLHIANRKILGLERLPQLDDFRQIGDVTLHCDKGDANLRFGKVIGRSHFGKALQVTDDIWQFGPHAHVRISLWGSAVDRNPDHIQTRVD